MRRTPVICIADAVPVTVGAGRGLRNGLPLGRAWPGIGDRRWILAVCRAEGHVQPQHQELAVLRVGVRDVVRLDERVEYSVSELVERSRLPEADLLELLDCGAIPSRDGRALAAARLAARLRRDFELDLHGVALAMTLLTRVNRLEAELARLRALTP